MLVDCPGCGFPATVESRGDVFSTTGAVELLHLRCINRHWFLAPADRLRAVTDARAGAAVEATGGHGALDAAHQGSLGSL
jgi:hypothetical protein